MRVLRRKSCGLCAEGVGPVACGRWHAGFVDEGVNVPIQRFEQTAHIRVEMVDGLKLRMQCHQLFLEKVGRHNASSISGTNACKHTAPESPMQPNRREVCAGSGNKQCSAHRSLSIGFFRTQYPDGGALLGLASDVACFLAKSPEVIDACTAFDGAASVLRHGETLKRLVVRGMLGDDKHRRAQRDVIGVYGDGAFGVKRYPQRAFGALARIANFLFLEENIAGVGVEQFRLTGGVFRQPGLDALGRSLLDRYFTLVG